jgi:1-acyl-sn-glycerol-3-phosphate acyltransferase
MLNVLLLPLRFSFRLLWLLFHGLLVLPLVLAFSPLCRSIKTKGGSLEEVLLTWWPRHLCFVFGVRLRVSGDTAVSPVLLLVNHISWLDILALHGVKTMSFVSKAEIRKWPLVGLIARAAGVIFHHRGNQNSANDVAMAMTESLKAGRTVAIFPEGGIFAGDSVKRFHARLLKAAVDADCPVQPVMLRYVKHGARDTDMTFRKGEHFVGNLIRLLARPGCFAELRFLTPLDSNGRPRKELADLAQARVSEAFESGME